MFIIIILILILTCILVYINKSDSGESENIPGPKPVPVFGNVLDFFPSTSKFLLKLMEYLETYGGVFRLHLSFSRNIIAVTDYKLTEEILTSSKILDKSFMYDSLDRWLATGLLTSTGAKWKSRRKMITPSFHFSILTEFIKVFDSVGEKFVQKLDRFVGMPSVDISPLVSLCTLDVICDKPRICETSERTEFGNLEPRTFCTRIFAEIFRADLVRETRPLPVFIHRKSEQEAAMGTSVNALDNEQSEYVQSVKTMCAIVVERIFTPFHRWLYPLTPNYFRERKALKVLHSHTDAIIDKRIKSRAASSISDEGVGGKRRVAFLDMLLESNIDGRPLSRADLREEVNTFMFEGHDTTSSGITFALYALANHPDVQRKVVEEQRAIFGSNRNTVLTTVHLQDMKYLELVIKETLRLYPSVPVIGRELNQDLKSGGTVLSKGQAVAIFIFGIHRRPEYFPKPLEFIPERFEQFDGRNPFSYIPFSAGPRNCIGQKFALMEMKTTISKIVRNFELFPSEPKHVLELAPEATLVSKNGVRISLKRRLWE